MVSGEGVAQHFDVVVQKHSDALDLGCQGVPQFRITGFLKEDGA